MGRLTVETTLLGTFLDNYEDFRRRLRRRLRSDDLVDDVLQETYLKVERLTPGDASSPVLWEARPRAMESAASPLPANPTAYLFRMALNMAVDQHRSAGRLLTGAEVDELLHGVDDPVDPPTVLASRQDLEALGAALDALTRRQREILIAARVEEQPHTEIASRHGISVRMVGKELKKALETCATKVGRRSIQRFGPGAGDPS
ncbi:RNA polymerase sigma factor [Luteibacter yeojuensis]|uniref:RNA polymerase sigma factor n=1 Tax=Luteibacter yeojuensis TaxID=345309 RepID=A0A7X5QT36_9GAMM|nr:RNA polymerase sigma factor [Luteibacter yeojuensis]NID14918.1 RNA polymerase sigma factor [Luteibacter yeojuensis]